MICSPPDAVPLRFGDNSYYPHLEAAEKSGIEPMVMPQPGIAMDIDHPVDLAAFLAMPHVGTRTRAFSKRLGVPKLLANKRSASTVMRTAGLQACLKQDLSQRSEDRVSQGWEPSRAVAHP